SAILVPRFGGDATADWYSAALPQRSELGISTKIVPLLPESTKPGIEERGAAISETVVDGREQHAAAGILGNSIGRCGVLAVLGREGARRTVAGLVSVAGWCTVYDVSAYPALAPWLNLDLDFASIAKAAGPITVLLSDNDPFTKDWRTNAATWLDKLGATVR